MLELKNYLKKLSVKSNKLNHTSTASQSSTINSNKAHTNQRIGSFQKGNFNRLNTNYGTNTKEANKPKLCLS